MAKRKLSKRKAKQSKRTEWGQNAKGSAVSGGPCAVQLVAGLGFEPRTFRLLIANDQYQEEKDQYQTAAMCVITV